MKELIKKLCLFILKILGGDDVKQKTKPVLVLEPPKPVKIKPKVDDIYKEDYVQSPFYSKNRKITPKYIVLHDSYGSYKGGIYWMTEDPKNKSGASYHYLIDTDGNRTQLVYDTRRAWHAGVSFWEGITDMNSNSIGLAFTNDTHKRDTTFEEIDSCAIKCIFLMKKFGIPKKNIITHEMIAPNRKDDTAPATHKKVLERIDYYLGL